GQVHAAVPPRRAGAGRGGEGAGRGFARGDGRVVGCGEGGGARRSGLRRAGAGVMERSPLGLAYRLCRACSSCGFGDGSERRYRTRETRRTAVKRSPVTRTTSSPAGWNPAARTTRTVTHATK